MTTSPVRPLPTPSSVARQRHHERWTGNDVFRYFVGFGSDTINGFDSDATGGQDLVDIASLGVTTANFASLVGLTQVGGNVRVSIGGNTITLTGQVLANITIDDFIVG